MSEEPEFEKPKPPRKAMTVHELRRVVKARHKFLAATKPVEEALELLDDEYGADYDSCVRFLEFVRGGPLDGDFVQTKNTAIERRHVIYDPETGDATEVETQPGSIPPRPV